MMRVTNIYGVFYLFIYLNEKPRKRKKKEEKLSKWPQEMSVYHTESKWKWKMRKSKQEKNSLSHIFASSTEFYINYNLIIGRRIGILWWILFILIAKNFILIKNHGIPRDFSRRNCKRVPTPLLLLQFSRVII